MDGNETIVHSTIDAPESLDNGLGHSLNRQRCHRDTANAHWLVIQSRGAISNSGFVENFNRSWMDYKNGFGDLNGDFWYGNDLLHRLTRDDDMELRVSLTAWNGSKLDLDYGLFRVDSEQYNYNLIIGDPKFNDLQFDSMSYHNNQDFSTFDRRNDKTDLDGMAGCCSCAISYGGGWWFNK